MDPTTQAAITEQMHQSHLSISQNDMMHEIPQDKNKIKLYTIISFLVLTAIVSLTIYSFILNNKNRSNVSTTPSNINPSISPASQPTVPFIKVYTSISEASKDPGNVVILDLSNTKDKIPEDFSQFINLKSLSLTGKKLTVFPIQVLKMSNLERLDLNNNQINSLPHDMSMLNQLKIFNLTGNNISKIDPEIKFPPNLTDLLLAGNKIDQKSQEFIRKQLPNTTIVFDHQLLITPTIIEEKSSK